MVITVFSLLHLGFVKKFMNIYIWKSGTKIEQWRLVDSNKEYLWTQYNLRNTLDMEKSGLESLFLWHNHFWGRYILVSPSKNLCHSVC